MKLIYFKFRVDECDAIRVKNNNKLPLNLKTVTFQKMPKNKQFSDIIPKQNEKTVALNIRMHQELKRK